MVSRLVILLILTACFLLAGNPAAAGPPDGNFDMGVIAEALKQAEERAGTISLPEETEACPGRKEAEAVMQRFRSPEYRAGLRAEEERLKQKVFSGLLEKVDPQPDNPAAPAGKLAGNERVYLFVSSSVELATLRSYAAVIDKARDPNVVMVLRGFVGGMKKIKPTMEFIGNVLKKDPACDPLSGRCGGYNVPVQVDPLLFRRFRVEQVPTVVYTLGRTDVEGNSDNRVLRNFSISGDAGLDWLLERINREAKSETMAGLVNAMRAGENP